MRHLHLDPIGGVAGDMFVAALLDAFPEHEAEALATATAVSGVPCQALRHRDGALTGLRFAVRDGIGPEGIGHDHGAHHHHHHAAWCDIRARLRASVLPEEAKRHAVAIFALLAEAEAKVHGVEPEAVTFHEVGAADSIADIVAAATLLARIGPASWGTAPLPLGGGRVRTAHGVMPVPAPATAILLRGFAVLDDGVDGERVTPTGAAILRHLCPPDAAAPAPRSRRLDRTGFGFGTRALPGLSNCLRVVSFDEAPAHAAFPQPGHRQLAVISFEVDDQAAEDLAAGLDRVRAAPGVHDALQMPAFGKKGRMATHVQVLASPEAADAVAEACFRETTTIGLRVATVEGRALPRRTAAVEADGRRVRVKLVDRPGGRTGKAESDDMLAVPGHAARARLRRDAEREAEIAADHSAEPA